MESIGVFRRIDHRKRCGRIESVGERQLEYVAVDFGVVVEVVERLDQRLLPGRSGNVVVVRDHADLLARLVLLLHVRGARAIVTYEDGP